MQRDTILLLLLLTLNVTLYGAANGKPTSKSNVATEMAEAIAEKTISPVAKPRFKRDVADEISAALTKKSSTQVKRSAPTGPPKYIPTAGKSNDRKNAQLEYAFLFEEPKNEDIKDRLKRSLPIISNSFNKVECLVTHRPESAQKHIYNNQRYRIGHPEYELTGSLGDLLYRLDALNKKLTNRQWVCSCTSNSDLLTLKSEFGRRDIKSLRVPTNRNFDLALERNSKDGSYNLTVYEAPDYKLPTEDFV